MGVVTGVVQTRTEIETDIMAEEGKKNFKWSVKAGGSGAMDQATATAVSNSNAASKSHLLRINPGNAHAPKLDKDASSIAHATSVPDHSKESLKFQKGDGTSAVSADSAAIAHAVNAPKAPRTINTVDKTKQVTSHPGFEE